MKKYKKLLRIEQWIKNIFIFLPLFFSGFFFDTHFLTKGLFAFIIFSLVASSIYIINDYIDIEADRMHPEKSKRPLASGEISKNKAIFIFILLILCIIISVSLVHYSYIDLTNFIIIICSYFIMNILYTIRLKQIAIVDISIIAIGFVLRVLAGGYITNIPISQWTIVLTFVLALVLAIGKRRGELINSKITGETRKALDGYNIQFADIILAISCTLAVICYLMFTLSPDIQNKFGESIFYTIFFVIFAFLRYLQQTLVYNKTESPTKIIYRDKYIQVTLLLWFISFVLIIYFKQNF